MSNLELEHPENISFNDTPDSIYPAEILFAIFLSLDTGDRVSFYEALNNCRLACKYFNKIGYTLLVRYVELGYKPSSASVIGRDRVLSMLQDQPSLAAHIRNVSFHCSADDIKIRKDRGIPVDLTASWLKDSPLLSITGVRSLSIATYTQSLQRYEDIGPTASGYRLLLETYLWSGKLSSLIFCGIRNLPLHDIMMSPTLANISLDDCSVKSRGWIVSAHTNQTPMETQLLQFSASNTFLPAYLLALMANAEKITLADILWLSDAHVYGGPPVIFSKLTELVIDYIGALAGICRFHSRDTKNITFFPALKVLSFRFQAGDYLGTHRIVFSQLNSLEKLTLFKLGEHGTGELLHLAECLGPSRHCLREFHAQWTFSDQQTSYPLEELCDTLYSFRGENRLNILHLRPTYPRARIDAVDLADLFQPSTVEWTRLSEILTQQDDFPYLRSVTIDTDVKLPPWLSGAIGEGRDEGWLQEHVRELLGPSFQKLADSSNIDFELKNQFGIME